MSDLDRKVLERAPDGSYQFTKYGEFLSYYHAHLQIFGKIVTESKKIPEAEKSHITNEIKAFMKSHVKHVDHFFHYAKDFAGFLKITQEELTSIMNKNFLDVLQKVQEKLKAQEIEKISKSNKFSGITEEIVAIVGEIFPPKCRFILQDGLIVIENLATGTITQPQGILKEIKTEREKEEEKKRQLQEQLQRLRERNVEKFLEEVSILKEIVDNFGTITEVALELKPEIIQPVKVHTIVTPETKKEKGPLDDVEDLELELSNPKAEAVETEEEEQEVSENQSEEANDLADFLDSLESTPKKSEPDEADLFDYKQYLEITKTIQAFKVKNDVNGYNAWLSSASPVTKCFTSIRTNLSKEAKGQSIDWSGFYSFMQQKTNLKPEVIEKLKAKILHLDQLKSSLDICVHELKKQPSEVIQILKTTWPQILETFNSAPNYSEVESKLQEILIKIPETQRKPIENILGQAIQNLSSRYNSA